MIAEATMLTLLKGSLSTGVAAWAVSLIEGRWMVAAAAVPPLLLCGFNLRRLRGKRAEGPP